MRASMAGLLLVDGKNEHKIGAGLISYVQKWYIENHYLGYRNEINSYTLQRGTDLEPQAIELLSQHLYGFDNLEKNEVSKEDDHFTGTCDVIDGVTIYDTKVAKSSDTMPYFEDAPSKDYFAQGQVYMALYGVKKYAVVHTLLPTYEDAEIDAKILALPTHKRIVMFPFEFDPKLVEKMRTKVDAINEHYLPQIVERLEAKK
jgi:hypothetical protein